MPNIKLSPWAAKRTGTLNKFYTRPEVGTLLVEEIGKIEPKAVIDLGAGEGSLAAAVASEWPNACITTVDIDVGCVDDLHAGITAAGAQTHNHVIRDALDPTLPDDLGAASFDLAVCNPPFFRPTWKRAFADILQSADFADACPTLSDVTAEVLFLAQNLRLVKDGGTIAMIVPDGLATGWRALAFRRELLRRHRLKAAVQLPPYSFADTEAYCFILILEKGEKSPADLVKMTRLHDDGSVSKPIYVSGAQAEIRLDYAYHSLAKGVDSQVVTLRELGAQIQRGSLSTVDRKRAGSFVFHTGDFPAQMSAVYFESDPPDLTCKRLVIAEVGDILMARVDRELHQKITRVAKGSAAITDCVYRIRLPEQHRMAAFKALTSPDGRERIKATTKGVGARLLGKGELLDLPLNNFIGAA